MNYYYLSYKVCAPVKFVCARRRRARAVHRPAARTPPYNRLRPVTSVPNWLQPVTTGYNWLQPVTTGYNRLQPVTTVYNRLQPLTIAYLEAFARAMPPQMASIAQVLRRAP